MKSTRGRSSTPVVALIEFGVGEGGRFVGADQKIGRDAARVQRARELVRKAIVAEHAQHRRPADAQRREIVGDVAAAAGSHLGGDDTDPRNAGFARRLGRRRIVSTPAIQANVADHERRVSGEGLQNLRSAERHQAGKSEENSSSPHR